MMPVDLYGVRGVPGFEHTHRNEQNGQMYPMFKRESLIAPKVIQGYASTAYTHGKGVTFRYPIKDSLGRDWYPTLIPERDLY